MGKIGKRTLAVIAATIAFVLALALAVSVGAGAADGGRTFNIALSGANEVDPPNEHGDDDRGSVALTINVGQRTVCWAFGELTLTAGEALPHAGHIHVGSADVAGPVVLTLFGAPVNTNADNTPAAPESYPTGTECVTGVDRSLLVDIFRSPQDHYVNLHNVEHPTGVVRGQLR